VCTGKVSKQTSGTILPTIFNPLNCILKQQNISMGIPVYSHVLIHPRNNFLYSKIFWKIIERGKNTHIDSRTKPPIA
jgi:hypothetical protein